MEKYEFGIPGSPNLRDPEGMQAMIRKAWKTRYGDTELMTPIHIHAQFIFASKRAKVVKKNDRFEDKYGVRPGKARVVNLSGLGSVMKMADIIMKGLLHTAFYDSAQVASISVEKKVGETGMLYIAVEGEPVPKDPEEEA